MTENIYTEPHGEYLRNNPAWHVEDSSWKARQVMKMLNRNSLNPKTVAEAGCGAGEILISSIHQCLMMYTLPVMIFRVMQ